MDKKFILLIFACLMLLTLFSTPVCANSDNLQFIINTQNTEFLSGDNFADWISFYHSSKFKSVGIWSDGSFFINFGEHVNIYDSTGMFQNCIKYNALSGGIVKVKAIDNGMLQFLVYRDYYLITAKANGEIVDYKVLSSEQFAQCETDFEEIERKMFKSSRYLLSASEAVIEVNLPAKISLPFLKSTHIEITSQDGNVLLFDDNGIMFFKQSALIILIVFLFALLVCINVYANILPRIRNGKQKGKDYG